MQQISLLLWSWIETTRTVARGRLWGPFLVFALVQGGAIVLLTQFHKPVLAPVLIPLLRLVGGEAVLHYPVFYIALPSIFSMLVIILDLFVGAWLLGAGFLLFWQADHPAEPAQGAFGRARKAYGKLVLARVPLVLLVIVLLFLLPRALLGPSGTVSGFTLRAVRYGSVLVGSILEAFFLYAALAILVEGRSVGAAWKRSFSLAAEMPAATIGAVLVPNLIQIPVSSILRRSESIVRSLSPEVVAWVLFLAVLLYTVVAFYVVGAGARLFRIRTERAEI